MSNETYGMDGFRVKFLHGERELIKSDSLFLNIYGFWVMIHVPKFMKVNRWYHPKKAKLEKILRKKMGRGKCTRFTNYKRSFKKNQRWRISF